MVVEDFHLGGSMAELLTRRGLPWPVLRMIERIVGGIRGQLYGLDGLPRPRPRFPLKDRGFASVAHFLRSRWIATLRFSGGRSSFTVTNTMRQSTGKYACTATLRNPMISFQGQR